MIFSGGRWANGTCKLHRACTFAHGEKELEAWNEHLKNMEKEKKMKTEEGKEERTTDGRPSSSLNKVRYSYVTLDPLCNYDFFLTQGKPQSVILLM